MLDCPPEVHSKRPATLVILLLCGILTVATFLRFYKLAEIPPSLYPDEAMNGSNTLDIIQSGGFPFAWKAYYPENNGREGLFINLQSLVVERTGNTAWSLRSLSALFGTLTVFGIFLLARLLANMSARRDAIALIAAWFLAVSFWHVNFSRIGFRAIMAPLLLTWSLYFLYRLVYGEYRTGHGAAIFAAIGGILYGLGFHTYIAYRVTPLLLIIPLIAGLAHYRKLKVPNCFPCLITLFCFFAFVAALPMGLYYLEHPQDFFGRTAQISIFSAESPVIALAENTAKTVGMFFVYGDANWRHNFSGRPALAPFVAAMFIIGIVRLLIGVFGKKHEERDVGILLFSWIVLALLPVVISSEGIPHALRAILTVPAVMIISAFGVDTVWCLGKRAITESAKKYPESQKQFLRIGKECAVLLVVVLVVTGIQTFNLYFLRWAVRPEVADAFAERYSNIAESLNTLPDDLPKYVIVNAPGTLVRGIPMPTQPIMFLTNTFNPSNAAKRNIQYIMEDRLNDISCASSCAIIPLEPKTETENMIRERFPDTKARLINNLVFFTQP